MNYDTATEQDINMQVSMIRNPESVSAYLDGSDSAVISLYESDGSGTPLGAPFQTVDYCNSPADMWPIILEKEMHVGPVDWLKGGVCLWGACVMFDQAILAEHDHINPLRAAAIVYLKMMEAEK